MRMRLGLLLGLAGGLALAVTGCGLESSWSASPAYLGKDAAPGFFVAEAGAGETMEVGKDGKVVGVAGHITFTSEDIEENIQEETTYTTTELAITERTLCTLNGANKKPTEFVYELLALQETGGEFNVKIKYTRDGEATEVSVKSP